MNELAPPQEAGKYPYCTFEEIGFKEINGVDFHGQSTHVHGQNCTHKHLCLHFVHATSCTHVNTTFLPLNSLALA